MKKRQGKRLSLASLTGDEALKQALGVQTKETRPESMVPCAKPKWRKK